MAYTETKERNDNTYYYRVVSMRMRDKIKKKRKYLGKNLPKKHLVVKESQADYEFKNEKIDENIAYLKPKILPVLKKYGVQKAGIFGSYATGKNRKNSDVDVIFEPPKNSGFTFANIVLELKHALGKDVDVVTYKYVNPLLKKRILNEEKRIL